MTTQITSGYSAAIGRCRTDPSCGDCFTIYDRSGPDGGRGARYGMKSKGVAHDGIGAFLAGVLLAVSIEGYRRAR